MKYAVRNLRLHPAFSLLIILTLALGIGATSAIFSVVDRVLLRPLPYPDSNRLVFIATELAGMEFVASPEYLNWRQSNHVLEEMAAWPHTPGDGYLTVGDDPLKIGQTRVSDNFFDTLRVHPMLGRAFRPDECRPGGADVLILSHGLWTRVFGRDANVVGRTVTFEGKPFTIVGVLPPGFQFPEQAAIDVLTPLPISVSADRRQMAAWNVVGRLKPGVTFAQARPEFEQLFENTRRQHPEMYRRDTRLHFLPFHAYRVRNVRLTLLVLLGAAACVLLIACANVANLLLARASARRKELSIRMALGAGTWHLITAAWAESLLLAGLGGVAGASLAAVSVNLLRRFGPHSVPGLDTIAVNFRVLAFALVLSLITGLLCGSTGLRLRAHRTRTPRARFLVVAEVALSLILLICGGLLVKSLYRLQNQNMGFARENVLTADISFDAIPVPERIAFVERLRQLPGMMAAGLSVGLPPGGGSRQSTFSRSDRPLPEAWHRGDNMLVRRVTPGYFSALGTPLLKGRLFSDRDRAETNGVAVINETLARRYFGGENPLGKQIDGVGGFHWKTIVGIVADAKNRGLDQPADPEMFTPFDMEAADTAVNLVLRGSGDPLELTPAVRAALAGLSHRPPVTFRPLEGVLAEQFAGPRFNAALFSTFSAIALALALIGLYGVLSYLVTQRTQEIGIRMALGAWTPEIVKLIVVEAMALTVSGAAIGSAGAYWATRVLAAQLYDVRPHDLVTFGTVLVLLLATALLAAYLPARRAAQVDPMVALRTE